ncbi:hypothetical protein [Halobellus ruber]|uniref:Uncharacterized protein n=1 Tax=Halobellus ruber TaxID=2761102 RepID=A0A7J9SGS7_9EURY|nr:hypothetical protein [Halobellus ruber]MBB6645349.1 hypothetical protein [Halobellus ruber]
MAETEFVDDAADTGTDLTGGSVSQVSAHRSSPDRMVLVEADNSDGWIALDADAATSIER